jgi:hypothetical protein
MTFLNYQQEVCPDSQRLHWQGYVEFKKRISMKQALDILGPCDVTIVKFDNGASNYANMDIRKKEGAIPNTYQEFGTRKGNGRAASNALLKSDIEECESWDEVLGLPGVAHQLNWARDVWKRKPINILIPGMLRHWQIEVWKKVRDQDNRTILFVVDEKGGAGKSTFTKWLAIKKGAFVCQGGKSADIMHAFEKQEIVCIDLARSNNADYWPWQSMEYFKNGMAFSPKYESHTMYFNPCKVVVFCNELPDMTKLSRDRYSIIHLDHELAYKAYDQEVFVFEEEEEEVDFEGISDLDSIIN